MGDFENTLLTFEGFRTQVVEAICKRSGDGNDLPRRDAFLAKHGAELDTVILSVLTRIDAEDRQRFDTPLVADQPRARPRPPTLDEILRAAFYEVVAEIRARAEDGIDESDVADQGCGHGLRTATGVARNGFLRGFHRNGESSEAEPSAPEMAASSARLPVGG
jgi:hypothetical protein